MGLKLGSDPSFIKSQVCAVEFLEEMEIIGLRLSLIQLLQQDIAGFRSVPKSRSQLARNRQPTTSKFEVSTRFRCHCDVIVVVALLPSHKDPLVSHVMWFAGLTRVKRNKGNTNETNKTHSIFSWSILRKAYINIRDPQGANKILIRNKQSTVQLNPEGPGYGNISDDILPYS